MASSILLADTQTATGSGVGLNNGVPLPCNGVLIQADPGNTVNLLVGTKNKQTIVLAPGQPYFAPIDDVSKVYIKEASGGTCVANWNATAP